MTRSSVDTEAAPESGLSLDSGTGRRGRSNPGSGSDSGGGPQAAWLGGGGRLHVQHGPIDLIISAEGDEREAKAAYAQACARFESVLAELVDELPALRTECPPGGLGLTGPVARRMEGAIRPLSPHRLTPMAAVAGAVADEVLAAMTRGRRLDRAYVNNGGDIALVLGENRRFEVAMVGRPDHPAKLGKLTLRAADGVGGIATSGRHGRSFSLGIADSVTVLAANAAMADAAATLIANAVDLPDHPAVKRLPALQLDPDSDLGERPVTVEVGMLEEDDVTLALSRGAAFAKALIDQGRISAAALHLDHQHRLVGERAPRRFLLKKPTAG